MTEVSTQPPKGLLLVFTGEGKGKTTAALGVAVRAAGRLLRTHIIQFVKAPGSSGEQQALRRLHPLISLEARGTGFLRREDHQAMARARASAQAGWAEAARLLREEGGPDILVLDELTVALNYGLLEAAAVLEAISARRPGLHVIVTGRDAPEELCRLADLVTEMVPRKHPFEEGRKAERGLDF